MKRLLPLSLLLLSLSCKTSIDSSIISSSVTSEELKTTVNYLASDELYGRNTGTEGINQAATYIEKQLSSYGVKPYFDTYRDRFEVKGKDAFNVVGFIEGQDPELKEEVIIIGAHYDHIGLGKVVDNDSIANGANDNAAGTSSVLAMAKYFATQKTNKRSIMVALFSAEELGLLGSKHLAERLKAKNLNLYTMVNMEMIGVPMEGKDHMAYVSGYDLSNMADKMNEYAGFKLIGLLPKAKEFQLFMRSDNYPFYLQFGVPCQTICTFDFTNYEYYHHVDDEIEKLDYGFMADMVNKLIPVIEKMSNTPTEEIKMYE
ncbi:M28 family metallopeptidase [Mangrovimonas aestuarii]|uniref:M28 family metallopeptidase n=1 Tax=Mangrovimonas aestuarii TaxID=3018443 RepID=UPI0023788E8E|nr:M28 family peptidase [Mangrovimonas aestuarii]